MSVYGLLNGGGCIWIGDSRGWGGVSGWDGEHERIQAREGREVRG